MNDCERGIQKLEFEYCSLHVVAVLVVASLALIGCHKPITQPPLSLNLPGPVENLAVIRGDNMIWLTWTMPRKTTDKRRIKGDIPVQVCRRVNIAGACLDAGEPFILAPGVTGSFSEMLPPELASGTPRPLYYFVELGNRNGRSVGLINGTWTLAGSPPSPVSGLTAEVHRNTVLLRWTPATFGDKPDGAVIRVYRKLLTAALSTQAKSLSTLPSQLPEQNLLVEANAASGKAVDKDIRLGETYEYRAQRVARVTISGQTLELAGEFSLPVRIHVVNEVPSSTGPGK